MMVPTYTIPDLSDSAASELAEKLTTEGPECDEAFNVISELIVEACASPQRHPSALLLDHLSVARGMIAASRKLAERGHSERAAALAAQADLFLTYAVADAAELEAIVSRVEYGEPH